MSTGIGLLYTLEEGPLREDQEEFQTKCMPGKAACDGAHLRGETGLLPLPHGDVTTTAGGAVFDLHQNDKVTPGQGEVGLRQSAGQAAQGAVAVQEIVEQRRIFGQPPAQMGMQPLGKDGERG